MGSDLMFITQTGPVKSKEALAKIRKHVMKDIGRARRKGGRKNPVLQCTLEVPDSLEELNHSTEVETQDFVQQHNEPTVAAARGSRDRHLLPAPPETQPLVRPVFTNPPSIERVWTGRSDQFLKYPIEMNNRALQLMDHTFSHRYGDTARFKDTWLPIEMMDAAALHQFLSGAALNVAALRSNGRPPEMRESIAYHNKAIKLVRQKISDVKVATTDGIISTIAGFACYAHALGNQAGWHMHLNAVKEIIKLRGGIDTLYSNEVLPVVISCVDVEGCCVEDIPPRFPPATKLQSQDWRTEPPTQHSHLVEQLSESWQRTFPQHHEILRIMDDMRLFISYLKACAVRTEGKVYRVGKLAASDMLPLQHRLLSLISETVDDASQKADIVRLGCMLFFTEIRRLFGVVGIITSRQTRKLQRLLRQQTGGWEPFPMIKAWALAMGAMESSADERRWFFNELLNAKLELGFHTWDDMRSKFREILWYDDVHTPMFEELCNGVEQLNRDCFLGGSRFGGYRPVP